jgi:hypothetical protein
MSSGTSRDGPRCPHTGRKVHLALWSAEFGLRSRDTIDTIDIFTVLSRWLDAGLAPSTVRNRRTALQALWTGLDGKQARNLSAAR